MPTLIEVWDSRLGIAEIAGPEHSQIIVDWWKDAGHPEIALLRTYLAAKQGRAL